MSNRTQTAAVSIRTATQHTVEIVLPTIEGLKVDDVVTIVLQPGASVDGRPTTQTVNLNYRTILALAEGARW
jgi:hypothetical protein